MPQLLSVIKPSDSYIIQKLQSICKSYPINFLNGQARLSFLDSERDRINTETGNSIGVKEVIKDGSNYNDVRLYNTLDGEDTSKVTASVISKDEGKSYEFNPRKTGNNAAQSNIAPNQKNCIFPPPTHEYPKSYD